MIYIFNKPGVAGAVLHTPSLLIQSWFVEIYSKHSQSQAGRARELEFWENVHPTQRVMCHMSRVTCHLSHITCHMSDVNKKNIFFYTKKNIKKKIFQKNWARWLSWSVEGLLSTGPTPSSYHYILYTLTNAQWITVDNNKKCRIYDLINDKTWSWRNNEYGNVTGSI